MAVSVLHTKTDQLYTSAEHTLSLNGAPNEQLQASSLPQQLDEKFSKEPKLSREQCGHIRHFHNLASKLDGDLAFMGSEDPGQEWDTAYRYQLATMAYAAGAAHYHRLPAMRSMFKALILGLIRKMLRREVWGYWYLTSQSGINADPDLKELRKPWADPVCKENIMVNTTHLSGIKRMLRWLNFYYSTPGTFCLWSHFIRCYSTMTALINLIALFSIGIRYSLAWDESVTVIQGPRFKQPF